jgi:tRNA(fMet)-specific endonuclease VapC
MVILDTDHLTLLERDSTEAFIIEKNILQNNAVVCTTIITFEEQMRGWLAFVAKAKTPEREINAYQKLNRFLDVFCKLKVIDFDEKSSQIFQHLKSLKLKIGTMDLKIASIALANKATLLTRNAKDFEQIPNLKFEDWTISQFGHQ